MDRMLKLCVLGLSLIALTGCKKPQETTPTPGASGEGPPSPASAGATIKINGSDTMVNLGQAWAEAYMKAKPGVDVQVTGGGSGTGIAALINGTTDIAQCSRAMKDSEKEDARANGRSPVETQVAWDGLAVVVHPDLPIESLTIDQLSDIFTGKVSNWKAVGGPNKTIVLLSRESNSGTHVYFKEHVLRKGDKKSTEEYAASALLMPTSQAIHDEVMNNDQAIGYFGLGYVDEKVKALKIGVKEGEEAVAPTPETVISRDYPISRPLFLYTDGRPSGQIKDYVEFCLGPEGQKIVGELDFVPLGR